MLTPVEAVLNAERMLKDLATENERLTAEAKECGEREVKAWAERDQYMQTNVELVAMVERLKGQCDTLLLSVEELNRATADNERLKALVAEILLISSKRGTENERLRAALDEAAKFLIGMRQNPQVLELRAKVGAALGEQAKG